MEDYDADHIKRGYRWDKIGFGKKPAILVIDLQRYFTDEDSPMGGSPGSLKAARNTSILLKAAREKGILIIYTVLGFRQDGKDMGFWPKKIPNLANCTIGSKWLEMREEVKEKPEDVVLVKKMSSAFFGTELITILNSHSIDTTVITGFATSGCVRATVVDSFSYGFRTSLVEDCCGDQSEGPHEANIMDMNNKYADIISLEEALEYIRGL